MRIDVDSILFEDSTVTHKSLIRLHYELPPNKTVIELTGKATQKPNDRASAREGSQAWDVLFCVETEQPATHDRDIIERGTAVVLLNCL